MNAPSFNLLVLTITFALSARINSQEIAKGTMMLDVKEAAVIREIVYTKGLATSHEVDNAGGAYRVTKRVAVLILLLDVIKGARPQDALAAAAYAIALEESPIRAAFYVDSSNEDFDKTAKGYSKTQRNHLADWLEKRLPH
jgi:hypothetical protein